MLEKFKQKVRDFLNPSEEIDRTQSLPAQPVRHPEPEIDEALDEAKYQRGFNDGYWLAEHEPTIAQNLASKIDRHDPYFQGFREGMQELIIELQPPIQPEFDPYDPDFDPYI